MRLSRMSVRHTGTIQVCQAMGVERTGTAVDTTQEKKIVWNGPCSVMDSSVGGRSRELKDAVGDRVNINRRS